MKNRLTILIKNRNILFTGKFMTIRFFTEKKIKNSGTSSSKRAAWEWPQRGQL